MAAAPVYSFGLNQFYLGPEFGDEAVVESFNLSEHLKNKWRELSWLNPEEERIRQVVVLCLGGGDAYYFAYKTRKGEYKQFANGLPDKLYNWLFNQGPRDFQTLQVMITGNFAFFAGDKDGNIWNNLPPKLHQILQERTDKSQYPKVITVGPGNTPVWFIYIGIDGWNYWWLPNNAYSTLVQFLQNQKNMLDIRSIRLEPTGNTYNNFVLVLENDYWTGFYNNKWICGIIGQSTTTSSQSPELEVKTKNLEAELLAAQQEVGQSALQISQAQAKTKEAQDELERLRQQLQQQPKQARQEKEQIQQERQQAHEEKDKLQQEKEQLQREKEQLQKEKNENQPPSEQPIDQQKIQQERDQLTRERDQAQKERDDAQKEKEAARKEIEELKGQHEEKQNKLMDDHQKTVGDMEAKHVDSKAKAKEAAINGEKGGTTAGDTDIEKLIQEYEGKLRMKDKEIEIIRAQSTTSSLANAFAGSMHRELLGGTMPPLGHMLDVFSSPDYQLGNAIAGVWNDGGAGKTGSLVPPTETIGETKGLE